MDTNRDGIIDDPLVMRKKVGRKSLGLTKNEWKERRKDQRQQRGLDKAVMDRYRAIVTVGCDIIQAYEEYKRECTYTWFGDNKDCDDHVNERLRDFYMNMAKDKDFYIKPLPKFRS